LPCRCLASANVEEPDETTTTSTTTTAATTITAATTTSSATTTQKIERNEIEVLSPEKEVNI
jgi:hypothetical protein